MNKVEIKETLDKIFSNVFDCKNPFTLNEILTKFAFDVKLPQQVNDSISGEVTWATSINPTKYITEENTWKWKSWEQPKQEIESLEQLISLWNQINYRTTERVYDSTNVSESDTIYEVSDSKLKEADADFFRSHKVDSLLTSNKKITKLYDTTDIKKNRDDYYFMTEDGSIYRVIDEDYEHPILLCQFDDIKEWQVHDDGVSFIVGDTLYLYTDDYGLKPILVNPEFVYNSQNIYHFIRAE